jgi:cephalosporin hydroxylase
MTQKNRRISPSGILAEVDPWRRAQYRVLVSTTERRDMITIIDDEAREVVVRDRGQDMRLPLDSPTAFAAVSRAWLRAGWDTKYVYSFTWFGRPVIQLPDDLMRIQEVVYRVRPDVLIETGVAHGGSLVFYASLFKAMDHGRVVGVDVEIRPHNREAIERHELFPLITLIEGSSINAGIVQRVRENLKADESVMVVLDSNHSREHVLEELRGYGPLVSLNSYIVVTDGIMQDLVGAPRARADWGWNNPRQATLAYLAENPDFALEEPTFPFNEGVVDQRVTYWPDAFVKRVR